jgi:hypothetical protein
MRKIIIFTQNMCVNSASSNNTQALREIGYLVIGVRKQKLIRFISKVKDSPVLQSLAFVIPPMLLLRELLLTPFQ